MAVMEEVFINNNKYTFIKEFKDDTLFRNEFN